MDIIYLTAGTCNLYCGTCLRDQALVRGLRQQGCSVLLVPLYLPLKTEAPIEQVAPIFLGGVNIYLQQKMDIFRKTPGWLDRLFDSELLLQGAARMSGMTSPDDLGELTVDTLRGVAGPLKKEILRLTSYLKEQPKADVICLSNALLLGIAPILETELATPVVCTLQGEESFLDELPGPHREKAWEILGELARRASGLVAVSQWYGEKMATRLGLPKGAVAHVYNGMDLSDFPQSEQPEQPTIGFLSQLIERKGLGTLVDAFIKLKEKGTIANLQLALAGAIVPGHEAFVEEMKKRLSASGFARDVSWHVNVSRQEKMEFLSSLSLLSVPATYGEAFGLYVIEALAAAVPVVLPESAVFPELMAKTGGGVLYQEGELVAALEKILAHPEQMKKLGQEGREKVLTLFSQDRMSKDFMNYLEKTLA